MRAAGAGVRLLCQQQVIIAMTASQRFGLSRTGQPLRAELADGFQHPVPGPAARIGLACQHRLIDQLRDARQHVPGIQTVPSAHSLGSVQIEFAGKHRAAGPELALGLRAQVEAPLDGGLQCLVPGRTVPLPAREQLEAVLQPVKDLLSREHTQPDRGQLDRQRNAVQATA